MYTDKEGERERERLIRLSSISTKDTNGCFILGGVLDDLENEEHFWIIQLFDKRKIKANYNNYYKKVLKNYNWLKKIQCRQNLCQKVLDPELE